MEARKITVVSTINSDVKKVWDSQAVPELKGKAVELKDLLTEANGDISKLGDKVHIVETSPTSKSKRWRVTKVVAA